MLIQFLATLDAHPYTLLIDTLNTKNISLLILQKLISINHANKKKQTVINFEYTKEQLCKDISDDSNLIFMDESSKVFPSEKFDVSSIDNSIVIINSISGMILRYGFNETISMIYKLKSQSNIIFGVLHKDTFSEKNLETLKHPAKAWIKIQKENDPHIDYTVDILSIRQKSKLISTSESFSIKSGSLQTVYKVKEENYQTENKEIENLNNDLTFKLGLSQKEEEERSKVILPYVHEGKKLNELIKEDLEEYYEDYEADDPDDDLDL
eukprot:gene8099-12560_t